MQVFYELRDALMDEAERLVKMPVNEKTLSLIESVTHSIKSIDTIIAMQESRDEYSGDYHGGGRYSGESSGRRRYFYTQRDDGETSGRRRRDSMGRYADSYSNDDYSGDEYHTRYSRDEAKDKLIGGMEKMMDKVSPEAQHAIKKAIHALDRE